MKPSALLLLSVSLATARSAGIPDTRAPDCIFPVCTILEGEGDSMSCINSDTYPDGPSYIATHDELTEWVSYTDLECQEYLLGPSTHPDSPNSQVIPISEGTRKDCYEYEWFATDPLTRITGSEDEITDCWNHMSVYDTTPKELLSWNPSLEKQRPAVDEPVTRTVGGQPVTYYHDSDVFPCTLAISISYCVKLTSPTPSPGAQEPVEYEYQPQDIFDERPVYVWSRMDENHFR
ncbi:hypothetical protein BJX70DRAFT_65100 [Aspergillus crustosus]